MHSCLRPISTHKRFRNNLNLFYIPIENGLHLSVVGGVMMLAKFHHIPQNGLMRQCDLVLILICKIKTQLI